MMYPTDDGSDLFERALEAQPYLDPADVLLDLAACEPRYRRDYLMAVERGFFVTVDEHGFPWGS